LATALLLGALRKRLTSAKILVAEIKAKGLTLNVSRIPDSYAFTWFEEATKQDEPEIQTLFATLLLQAAQGNEEALQRRNVEIVSRMAPDDAKMLNYIADVTKSRMQEALNRQQRPWFEWSADYDSLLNHLVRRQVIPSMLPFENLTNLGVISESPQYTLDSRRIENTIKSYANKLFDAHNVSMDDALKQSIEYNLTLTGKSLIRALRDDIPEDNPCTS
jgi:Abortive infection alpha